MKKIIIAVIVIIGIIYLILLAIANTHVREFKEMMQQQPDSIRLNDSTYYFNKKVDSSKDAH